MATAAATLISAAQKSVPQPGGWSNGPHCLPLEFKGSVATAAAYIAWVEEVERRVDNTAAATQRLRLLYYGKPAGMLRGKPAADKLFDATIRTDSTWLGGPLTTDHASRRTLNRLVRTGTIDLGPDPAGIRRPLVDVAHLWPSLDLALNGRAFKGFVAESRLSLAGALSWTGDLGSLWIQYNTERLKLKAAAEKAGQPWTEDLNNVATALQLLEAGTATRSSLDDLLGDVDAQVLAAEPRGPLAAKLRAYYVTPPASTGDRSLVHVRNRFHLFVRRAAPKLPHTVGARGEVTLRPGAADIVRYQARAFAELAIVQARRDNATPTQPPVLPVEPELDSPWGAAVFDRIVEDFVALLEDGLADHPLRWKAVPSSLQDYGHFELRIGDSDAAGRYAGAVSGAPQGYVAKLQTRLRDRGFTLVTKSDGEFGPITAVALREFQIEAQQPKVLKNGAVEPVLRRYGGTVHGILDHETAEVLNDWASSGILNALRIESRPAPPGKTDLWAHDADKEEKQRMWAVDRLERYEGMPGSVAVGRYYINGPVSDVSSGAPRPSAAIRVGDFVPGPAAPTGAEKSMYRVIRAVAAVECEGYFDSVNAYDAARLSIGTFHWALMSNGVGELAALLAFYKTFDADAFERDFGRYGIESEAPWDPAGWNADGAHAQAKFAGRLALNGLRDSQGGFHPDSYPLGGPGPGPPVDDYVIDHLRSWRGIVRMQMAQRLSAPLRRAQMQFAALRVRTLLGRTFAAAGAADRPVVGARAATLGEVFTSEQAVAVLLRYHVNRPGRVIAATGAVNDALDAYVTAFGRGLVNLTSHGEPAASQRQRALVLRLLELAPTEQGFQKTVTTARDYSDAEVGRLSDAAGSFLGG